jgi:hypothetical protein
MRKKLLMPLLAVPFLALFACEEKSPAEKAVEDIKDSAEEVGDAIEEATD